MTWRVQKDDPIEKCKEAKEQFVWVIFKEGNSEEFYLPPTLPKICRLDPLSVYNTLHVIAKKEWYGEVYMDAEEIDRWQLIPTPAMPERFLNAKELEQVTTQYNNMNKKS